MIKAPTPPTPRERPTSSTPDIQAYLERKEVHACQPQGAGTEFRNINALRNDVAEALASAGMTHATEIQQMSIRHILRGKDTLIAAETGAGKTVAYLAPLISMLRDHEQRTLAQSQAQAGLGAGAGDAGDAGGAPPQGAPAPVARGGRLTKGAKRRADAAAQTAGAAGAGVMAKGVAMPNRPRALILVPTRELVQQVLATAKALSYKAPVRAIGQCAAVPPSSPPPLCRAIGCAYVCVYVCVCVCGRRGGGVGGGHTQRGSCVRLFAATPSPSSRSRGSEALPPPLLGGRL